MRSAAYPAAKTNRHGQRHKQKAAKRLMRKVDIRAAHRAKDRQISDRNIDYAQQPPNTSAGVRWPKVTHLRRDDMIAAWTMCRRWGKGMTAGPAPPKVRDLCYCWREIRRANRRNGQINHTLLNMLRTGGYTQTRLNQHPELRGKCRSSSDLTQSSYICAIVCRGRLCSPWSIQPLQRLRH